MFSKFLKLIQRGQYSIVMKLWSLLLMEDRQSDITMNSHCQPKLRYPFSSFLTAITDTENSIFFSMSLKWWIAPASGVGRKDFWIMTEERKWDIEILRRRNPEWESAKVRAYTTQILKWLQNYLCTSHSPSNPEKARRTVVGWVWPLILLNVQMLPYMEKSLQKWLRILIWGDYPRLFTGS